MLVKNICCWGVLRSARGYSTSLRLITALLEESILLAGSLSGELRYLVVFFNRTYPDTLEDRTIRLPRPTFIAPVSCGVLIVVGGQTFFW